MPGAIPGSGTHAAGAVPTGDSSTRLVGLIADRPAATPGNAGYTYAATDTGVYYQSNGATWIAVADLGGSGGGSLAVLDEGVSLDTAVTSIDLVGTLVSGTNVGHAVTITVTTPTKSQVGLGNVTNDAQLKVADLDTDGTLAANSDTKIPSQKAVKTYSDTKLASSALDTDGTLAANSDAKVASQKATKTYADTGLALKLAKGSNLTDVASAPASRYNLHDQVLALTFAVSTVNLTLSGTQTVDGVALGVGDTVLAVGQTAGAENGPWTVAAGAWSRPADYPAGGTVFARIVEVAAGTVYAGTLWVSKATTAVTIDTTSTSWSIVGVAAGTGLTRTGNTLAVQPDMLSRMIVAGHSFVTDSFGEGPYAGAYAWSTHSPGGSGARFPMLVANALGIDMSNRYIQVSVPPVAAGTTTNFVCHVPEDGILEGVWFLPATTLNGANTNTRRYAVVTSRNGASVIVAALQLNLGINVTSVTSRGFLDIGRAAADVAGLAFQNVSNVLLAVNGAMNALSAPAAGDAPLPSYLLWQSATVGTGLADPGGEVIMRWGGNFRNLAVSGSRLIRSGVYAGGWAAMLLGRPHRKIYGPEVNATPGEAGGATALRCDELEMPIPSGWKITMSGGVIATTTSATSAGATTIAVSALSGAVAAGEQGHARAPFANGYRTLEPFGLHLFGWGRNDVNGSTEETGWKESMRAAIALACSPYLQPADRANIVRVAGNGAAAAWAAYTAPAAGQWIVPWTAQGKGVARFTGAVGGTPPTLTIKLGPAYDGAPVDLFFLGQAGVSKGAAATITASSAFNGGLACTVNTTSACTLENLTTGLAGTVSGTTTLTLSSGTFDPNADVGKAIKATAGTGTIAKGTKIASIASATVATLDTAGTNGTVTAGELAGYVPLVKRLVGLTPGVTTITITLTGIDTTDASAELIFAGYGIESTPATPVHVVGICNAPADLAGATRLALLNTYTQAVIAGTATNPNGGNSLEPALPTTVKFDATDAAMGAGLVAANFLGDGVHLSHTGNMIHAKIIYDSVRTNHTFEQMMAR